VLSTSSVSSLRCWPEPRIQLYAVVDSLFLHLA
jgi:hypothetical protein